MATHLSTLQQIPCWNKKNTVAGWVWNLSCFLTVVRMLNVTYTHDNWWGNNEEPDKLFRWYLLNVMVIDLGQDSQTCGSFTDEVASPIFKFTQPNFHIWLLASTVIVRDYHSSRHRPSTILTHSQLLYKSHCHCDSTGWKDFQCGCWMAAPIETPQLTLIIIPFTKA